MIVRNATAGVVLFVAACATTDQAPDVRAVTLEPLWSIDGFDHPESVLFSEATGFLYLSNIVGEGREKDGDGYISRITLDGVVETRGWATEGLNAPKGLAERNGSLFVTDIDALVELDLNTGAFIARHSAPGADFLNDAATGPNGRIFASDSGTQSIYELTGAGMQIWLTNDRIDGANGVLAEYDRMLVVSMDTSDLVSIDYDTQEVVTLADGLGDADGIVRDPYGGYIATEWPGQIFRIAPDGAVTVLRDTRDQESYANDIWIVGDVLFVPEFNAGRLAAYRITPQ